MTPLQSTVDDETRERAASGTIPALEEMELVFQGRTRDLYAYGPGRLLVVTTGRLTCGEARFMEHIPGKAEVSNLLSAWWFKRTRDIVPNHLIESRSKRIFSAHSSDFLRLRGRMMVVRQTRPIRVECIVRGYLDGQAWREYQESGSVWGYPLPEGMQRGELLPRPIFTPMKKSLTGRDERISFSDLVENVGGSIASQMRDLSLDLFQATHSLLEIKGIELVDCKFEFGLDGDQLILIDEVLTPDVSRFRVKGEYFDKEILREFLEKSGWRGSGPPPQLPDALVAQLSHRYLTAFEKITGRSLYETINIEH